MVKEDNEMSMPSDQKIQNLSLTLLRQIEAEQFQKKYTKVADVLKLIGAGAFIATTLVFPTLPLILEPLLKDENEYTAWKRFNIPYLRRTLARLEKERLIETSTINGKQVVKVTKNGKRKIMKYAVDELAVSKPSHWDGKWYLVSYDFPKYTKLRNIFRNYLKAWGFYPFHKSVFLHAFPCEKQVDFLRDYLGMDKYVRIFRVDSIENDDIFRDYFGI